MSLKLAEFPPDLTNFEAPYLWESRDISTFHNFWGLTFKFFFAIIPVAQAGPKNKAGEQKMTINIQPKQAEYLPTSCEKFSQGSHRLTALNNPLLRGEKR